MTTYLDERTVAPDPFEQFRGWYDAAVVATDDRAAAMTVATATPDGRPSARVVLLRGFDERGFVFYSNTESRKAVEVAANPRAAVLFHWPELERQVRAEGSVAPLSRHDSAAYFARRPRGHRIGAWASPQSRPIASRAALETRLAEAETRFATSDDVPLPPFWGGYRVTPHTFEFWVSRVDRLHDRVRYALEPDGSWVVARLAP
jgi:pyridoxamine 5'-phosphate oxidase